MSSDMVKEFMPEEQRARRIVAAVKAVADEIGRSMAQVALAWLRYRPVSVIPLSVRGSCRSSRTTLRVLMFRSLPSN